MQASTAARLDEYRTRGQARQTRAAQLRRRDAWLGFARLALVLALLALLWLWRAHRVPAWTLPIPVACFVPVAALQARAARARTQCLRASAMYEAGLARIENRWPGSGQQQPRGAHENSLFATDLDLFGRHSLFALLSTARTRMGEDTLANWLLHPAAIDEIASRHAAIAELRVRMDLREDAAVLGENAGSAVHAHELETWAESPAVLHGAWLPVAALAIALLVLAALISWAVEGLRAPLFLMLAIAGGFHMLYRRRVQSVLHGADRALADLGLLAALMARFEREQLASPLARRVQAMLQGAGGQLTASGAIARLRRLGGYIDARENVFVKVANVPLLYSLQMAFAAERWRARHGALLRQWLGAVGQMEALLSLATYSWEHPEDPFPEIATDTDTEVGFAAEGLGHPLLAADRCVRNDVVLTPAQPLVLISGSNMSGKSTLLRAIGVNAVLAMAGAPVRARSLRLVAVEVGASILVNDSLASGASRFYAEIERLRAICDRAAVARQGGPRLLFLLDELLEGTNSRDRRAGAEGILRTLAARGAMGLVSTHDLALTETHGDVPVVNRHFEDAVMDGRMSFDYTLREGVVSRSNGVELMRMVGLDV